MQIGMMQCSLSTKPKDTLDKWRVFFIIFLVVYASFLVFDLGAMTIQWDEANHLNGGLLLLHGHAQRYMNTAMFYPPLDDLITTVYFGIGGVSVFNGRLVTVTFALLSLLLVYEFTSRTLGKKIALLSAIFLGTMPGFIWLARLALVETMLIFFFSLTLFFFFLWLHTSKNLFLSISGVALGLGILAKYQTIIALIVMGISVLFLCKNYIKLRLFKIPLLILTAFIIVLPWILFSYQVYSAGMFDQWLYAMNIGNPDKLVYSSRIASPIFYLIEITWPYGVVHPISIFMYVFGLLGLGLLLWKRRPEDKFLLIWFAVVYLFFTLIGNKQWRYVVPLFPVLAISAANLTVMVYNRAESYWKKGQIEPFKRYLGKTGAGFLIALVTISVAYSCLDAYVWISKDYAYSLPVEDSTRYVATRLNTNESVVVLCAVNVFCSDIVKFYIHVEDLADYQVLQYPNYPVDTYTPNFSITELVNICEQQNVKYLMLFEYGEIYPYYESTLTKQQIHTMLIDSQKFVDLANFGNYPCRIFILSFV